MSNFIEVEISAVVALMEAVRRIRRSSIAVSMSAADTLAFAEGEKRLYDFLGGDGDVLTVRKDDEVMYRFMKVIQRYNEQLKKGEFTKQ